MSATPRHSFAQDDADRDGVELSLLNEDERRAAAGGSAAEQESMEKGKEPASLSDKDKQGMALLVVLYLIQGVPLGLSLGSIPFILRAKLSYSQLGVFALSAYPYSLKLLWSPVVDSLFVPSIGRRKSWIMPMQLIIGMTMLWIALNVQDLVDNPEEHVTWLTIIFFSLVFFSATQDIAVDGWALTLLSPENVSYASTAQTVGLNTGFFMSFTCFLAFNNVEFTSKWGIPRLTLTTYMGFWSIMCIAVTLILLFLKKEDPVPSDDPDLNLKKVYGIMWKICKLKNVQLLLLLHFVAKIGFQANDAVTSLKLVEKGMSEADLALAVLIDFPCQLIGGYYAAKWANTDKPLRPWYYAFWARLFFAGVSALFVYFLPKPPMSTGVFVLFIVLNVLSSFAGTIQFVGVTAYHTRIADPVVGGTYMTLLNTASNLGGTWPRYFVLKAVDMFSVATCHVKEGTSELLIKAAECVSEHGKKDCKEIGGACVTEQDGYYTVSIVCIVTGTLLFIFFILPVAKKLEGLPKSSWRVGGRD
ncbi:MFS general substrate transporter [Exidia glandulosa HHB12029]|uniref:MFS general substrate transporter n=1 Tax=Exidia glandulosa HHB12029 TaxID=1314781 RepID=A0A165K094_EXIGL|nr:MFS general substrate transporter [Exidia glandulosa HHB12029]